MAKGPLLHLLVAASVEQMANFGAFEAEIVRGGVLFGRSYDFAFYILSLYKYIIFHLYHKQIYFDDV